MQMEYIDKIVDFHKYCRLCEHEKESEDKDPCHTCLSNPTNIHSAKPIKYKEKIIKKG